MEIEHSVSNYVAFQVESRHVIRFAILLIFVVVVGGGDDGDYGVLTGNNDVAVCVV